MQINNGDHNLNIKEYRSIASSYLINTVWTQNYQCSLYFFHKIINKLNSPQPVMHSYVNHSKTAKKIYIQPSAVISPNKPNSRVLLNQATNQTNQTNHWVALGGDRFGMEVEAFREEKGKKEITHFDKEKKKNVTLSQGIFLAGWEEI